jgi:hypothetical protein
MHSEAFPSGPAFRRSVSKKYKFCKIPLDFILHPSKMARVPVYCNITRGHPSGSDSSGKLALEPWAEYDIRKDIFGKWFSHLVHALM